MSKANGKSRSAAAVLDPDHESDLPSINEAVTTEVAETIKEPEPEPPPVSRGNVTLNLPVQSPVEPTYYKRHIDMRLSGPQQKALRWLFEGLHADHAKLANGHHIDGASDVLKFILDEVASKLELSVT